MKFCKRFSTFDFHIEFDLLFSSSVFVFSDMSNHPKIGQNHFDPKYDRDIKLYQSLSSAILMFVHNNHLKSKTYIWATTNTCNFACLQQQYFLQFEKAQRTTMFISLCFLIDLYFIVLMLPVWIVKYCGVFTVGSLSGWDQQTLSKVNLCLTSLRDIT